MNANALGTIAALGGLVLVAVLIAAVVWLAKWMLEPINRAAGSLNAPTRFMLIDFVSLMILLQIGLAICGQALSAADAGDAATRMYWLLLGIVAVLVLVLWSASVSVVSRAGIRRPLRRILVSVVLVPGALAAIMGAPTVLIMLAAGTASLFHREPEISWTVQHLPWLALAVPALVAIMFVLRRLSFWSLSGSTYAASLEAAGIPSEQRLG